MDMGSIQVALPVIESYFETDLPTVQWVVVAYALAICVLLLPMGRLGDLIGRKQVYLIGFSIYVASAALCCISPNIVLLICFRVCQGIGSAMIQSNAMAMVISAFGDNERGKALGSNMSVVGSGFIVGPALGGLLVSVLDWRAVFFINVPVGLIAILVSVLVLNSNKNDQGPVLDKRFDWLGAILSGCALLFLLMVVGNGSKIGWSSPVVFVGIVLFVASTVFFIFWELRYPAPMLELRLFKKRLVALGVSAGWLSFFGISAARFLLPFYLQKLIGLTPGQVGLLLIPAAVCMIIFGPISGRLSDRFGWRNLTMGGMALSSSASFVLVVTLSENTSVVLIAAMLMVQSMGTGLFNSPNNSSIFSAVERSDFGVMSAVTQLVRNSANVTSVALSTSIVVTVMAFQGYEPSLDAVSPQVAGAFVDGLKLAFFVLGCFTVVGFVIAFVRGERIVASPKS